MTQSAHALIAHQKTGGSFDGIYYVESLFVKKAKNNKDYTEMVLRDKSGSRPVKYWGVTKDVEKGNYVYIAANVEDYMGNPSIIARNIEKTDEPTDLSDYIPMYEDADQYAGRFDKIRQELAALEAVTKDTTAGKLVDEVYGNSTFFGKFVLAPGSSMPHYGRQGGLLANTVRVAEVSLCQSGAYGLNAVEKSVLIASALLCRIGVIDAFEFQNCVPTETKKGKLLGVNNLTMSRVSSALKRAIASLTKDNLVPNQDVIVRILHAVSSIDGVTAMTKESMLLAASFYTDAEVVNSMDFISNDTNATEEFTAFDPVMRRQYYVGNR